MSSVYRGFDVVTRPGMGSAMIIKAKMESHIIQSLLGGDYPCLLALSKYDVELYGGTRDGAYVSSITMKNLKGFSRLRAPGRDLDLEFEIPVSSELVDRINEIRRKGLVVTFVIRYSFDITQLGVGVEIRSSEGVVEKTKPTGERSYWMEFSTEEIDELMKEIAYIEVLRFEVPVPLIPDTHIEILTKSVSELKNVEENIIRGNYHEALRISRNIVMNYLTELVGKEGKKKRVLRETIREYIISKVPSDYRSIYESILDGIENAVISNLNHIHRFIKEETGKMIAMPSREEAEYVYFLLLSILRYLSQLTITWSKGTQHKGAG
jgi:hypothetical protein